MKTLLTLLATILLAPAAWGADGDQLNGAEVTKGTYSSRTVIFCDTKTSASSTCDEFDLQAAGFGMPAFFLISRDTTTGCTGNATVAINGQTTTGGTEHVITTLDDTTTAVQITGPHHRFIDADLSGVTACTDLDVHLTLFYLKE